jgi:hypothetical protein
VAGPPWLDVPRAIGIVRVEVPEGAALTAGATTATTLA